MDKFGVPKKVNRHVLKALYYMNDRGCENPDFFDICDLVKINMKNNVPVRDLPGVVRQSLQNMVQLGVIKKIGACFFVRNTHAPSTSPKDKDLKIFRANKADRENDASALYSYLGKRRRDSEDSISGNDVEKSRKRFRSTKLVKRKGRPAELPKVRVPQQELKVNDGSLDGLPYEPINKDEGNDSDSEYSLATELRSHLITQITDDENDNSQPLSRDLDPTQEHEEDAQSIGEQNGNTFTEVVTAEQTFNNSPEDTNCSISSFKAASMTKYEQFN